MKKGDDGKNKNEKVDDIKKKFEKGDETKNKNEKKIPNDIKVSPKGNIEAIVTANNKPNPQMINKEEKVKVIKEAKDNIDSFKSNGPPVSQHTKSVRSLPSNPVNGLNNINNQNTLGSSSGKEYIPKKMSDKKAMKILKSGGMINAYQYLMESLCKNGLPTGDIYEYAAFTILNYERKWKELKSKEVKEKINKYWEEKEKELKVAGDSSNRKLNRSVDHGKSKAPVVDLKRSQSAKKIKEVPKRSPSPILNTVSSSPKNNNKNSNAKNLKPIEVKTPKAQNEIDIASKLDKKKSTERKGNDLKVSINNLNKSGHK